VAGEQGPDIPYKMTQGRVVPTGLDHVHRRKKVETNVHWVSEDKDSSVLKSLGEPLLVDEPPRLRRRRRYRNAEKRLECCWISSTPNLNMWIGTTD
jgi:hypothetical protein